MTPGVAAFLCADVAKQKVFGAVGRSDFKQNDFWELFHLTVYRAVTEHFNSSMA